MTPAGLMVTNDSQLPEKQNEELSTDNKLPCNDLDCVITDSGVVVSHLQVHHSGPRSKFSDNLEGFHFEPFRCDPRLFSFAAAVAPYALPRSHQCWQVWQITCLDTARIHLQ